MLGARAGEVMKTAICLIVLVTATVLPTFLDGAVAWLCGVAWGAAYTVLCPFPTDDKEDG